MQMSELFLAAIKNHMISKIMAVLFQETDVVLPIWFSSLLPSSKKNTNL